MDAALGLGAPSLIPFAELIRFTKPQLRKLQTWSDVTGISDAAFLKKLAIFHIHRHSDVTTSTSIEISRAIAHHEAGFSFVFGNAESVVHTKGGSFKHGNGTLDVELPNVPVVSYDTSSGYPVNKPRPHMTGLLALLASSFQINKGELKFTFDAKAMSAIFDKAVSAIDPDQFVALRRTWEYVLIKDAGYAKYANESRGCSGLQLWDYFAVVLKECDLVDYISLHDTVCKWLLQHVEVRVNPRAGQQGQGAYIIGGRKQRQKDQQMVDITGEDTVRLWPLPEALSSLEWADAIALVTEKMGHRPYCLYGPIPSGHKWVKPVATTGRYTLDSAWSSYNTRRALHSSGTNGSMAVLQSNGFSSVCSDVSNRCVLFLNLTLNALNQGSKLIDIRCSLNDVAYLEAAFPLVRQKHREVVRYILDHSDHRKVPVELREFLLTHPRENAHYIAWVSGEVAAPPTKADVTSTLHMQWMKDVQDFPTDCSVMLNIVSADAFSSKPDKAPHTWIPHYVHKLRGPADFQGIYSSHSVVARLADVEGNKWIPLDPVSSWQAWIDDVVKANSQYATFFLTPRGFYTPSSNLIRGVAKGTPLSYNDGQWEAKFYPDPQYLDDDYVEVVVSKPTPAVGNVTSSSVTTSASVSYGPPKTTIVQKSPHVQQKQPPGKKQKKQQHKPQLVKPLPPVGTPPPPPPPIPDSVVSKNGTSFEATGKILVDAAQSMGDNTAEVDNDYSDYGDSQI